METTELTFRLPKELARRFDEEARKRGFSNRSEALRYIVTQFVRGGCRG